MHITTTDAMAHPHVALERKNPIDAEDDELSSRPLVGIVGGSIVVSEDDGLENKGIA
jgi:hypothetical protein